jgi:hypothetical protein
MQPFEHMSLADQHTIRMGLKMMIMLARTLPTRNARIAHMRGQTFDGPHHTGQVVIDTEMANYIADLLDAESPAERETHLQVLSKLRDSITRR